MLQKKYPSTTLGDYLESTQYGYTASAIDSGNCKLLRITDINNGRVDWGKVPFCNCDTLEKYRLKNNDILVARTGGTTGKSFIVEDIWVDAVFASYLIRLRPKNGVVPEFLYAFLNSYLFWSQITEMKGGSAQPNVNAEKLKTVIIPSCNEEVQNLVVSMSNDPQRAPADFQTQILAVRKIFETTFETQQEHDHQTQLLASLRSAILREAIQWKLVPQDPSEWNAQDLLNQIKKEREQSINGRKSKKIVVKPIDPSETPFEIPENWVWCRMSEVCDLIMGQSPDGWTYNKRGEWMPFYQWKTEFWAIYPRWVSMWCTDPKRIALKGDILISVRAPVWDVNIADQNIAIGRWISVIRPIWWLQLFYFFYLLWGSIKRWKTKWAFFDAITKDQIEDFLIPLPPISEQIRIVQKVDESMEKFKGLEVNIAESKDLSERLLKVGLKEVFNT